MSGMSLRSARADKGSLMPSDLPYPASASSNHGLPPVEPPSGQMILRLFIVPAIIVGVLVVLFLAGPSLLRGFNRLIGKSDTHSAEQFLRDLDSSNPEVRSRAASDLAQVLLRNDALASDPGFALHLADRLQTAIDKSTEPEAAFASRVGNLETGERSRELANLDPDRKLITFLGASLGNCMIPVGAPLLERLAVQQKGMEPEALAERRRLALFALATLGENLKRYDQLSDADKDTIEQQLEATLSTSRSSKQTRATIDYLSQHRKGKNDSLGVTDALEKCSADEDPFLRELSALASNFWTGTPIEETRIEKFLDRLSHDDGKGEDQLGKNPGSTQSQSLTTRKGFKVQANATIALARRGSPRVRLDMLEEMLDPERLRAIFVLRGQTDTPDESLVALTLTNTLKALVPLHRKRPEMKLDRFAPQVDALTHSNNAAIRAEAQQTQLALKKE